MKCFRAKLSDRRDAAVTSLRTSHPVSAASPRHYCQRRMANSSHDEEEWLKRYTPERYHFDQCGRIENEGHSRPSTASSVSGTPELLDMTKNVFRPAFLTINNIDLPNTVLTTVDTKTWPKKRAKYKTVPKNCSNLLHRMFVKNSEMLVTEGIGSRASSRASTDYNAFAFEEYLSGLNLPDDSSECSLFDSAEDSNFEQLKNIGGESSNNNDSEFINKNDNIFTRITNSSTYRVNSGNIHKKDSFNESIKPNSPSSPLLKDMKKNNSDGNNTRLNTASMSGHKREKRKSITISRIPSPETVQVIRIDVITGYPVDSDNSVVSEATDIDHTETEDGLIAKTCKNNVSNYKYEKILSEKRYVETNPFVWNDLFMNDSANPKKTNLSEECGLLNCKSLNICNRSLSICNK